MDRHIRAKKLLEVKENGYSIKGAFKKSIKLYIGLILLSSLSAYYGFTHDEGYFVLVAGILLGTILRDYSWIKVIKQSWPFTVEITDWKKVEEIANEEEASNDSN